MAKTKVLIFIDWFVPAFKAGGPIKSVKNIIGTLGQDFDFYILTSDRDIGDDAPYSTEQLNQWVQKEDYTIAYLTPDQRATFIQHTIDKDTFDAYYFNSLYSKHYTLEPIKWLKKKTT